MFYLIELIMKHKSYQIEVVLPVSKEIAFKSISKELESWWGRQSEKISNVGQKFKVSWKEPWYEFLVIEYLPTNKMIWKCIDANQIIDGLEGVQKEWVDTELVWNLTEIDENQCRLDFIHQGLIPEFICYDFCSSTWDYFLTNKLKNYLNH